MSSFSSIEWTNSTWNPITGCTNVNQGCKHCHTPMFADRFLGIPGLSFEQGFDIRLWRGTERDRLAIPLMTIEARGSVRRMTRTTETGGGANSESEWRDVARERA
jgi:hypothetical protein